MIETHGRGTPRTTSKMETDGAADGSGSHAMGAAESGNEVVQRFFVSEVDDRKPSAPAVLVAVKQIVVADAQVEEVARGDAGWIVVVGLGASPGALRILPPILRVRPGAIGAA